jgi:DNA-binding beta-propeller fold protein YncE
VWVERYNDSAHKGASATSVAASPSGRTVFVTGCSRGATSQLDYATAAYDAATGAQLWVRRYTGPGTSGDGATSVTVNPAGGTVFVTGESIGTVRNFATIAYSG